MSDIIKRKISVEKFYKLDDAINSKINSKTVFILANERIAKDGNIGRYYVVFPSFKLFLKNREKYPNCHEIIVNHINNKIDQAGRLVFDFDIKYEQNIKIPKNFKQQIQDTIYNVVTNYYNDIDPEILEFVWSSSQNPKKLSKHLTVKNMYFDNWIIMSKIFYKLFCSEWDRKYLWISSSKLIDFQIVRNKASLRMVGSTKINGTPLIFDDNKFSLSDSLIRIYLKNQREIEQLITKKNINNISDDLLQEEECTAKSTINFNSTGKILEPVFDKIIYQKAYEMYNMLDPGNFKIGKINGNFLSLIRLKPNNCLLSGKKHEQENAFLHISKSETVYNVNFGCYRFCYKWKTTRIGSIDIDNYKIFIAHFFEKRKKNSKKKQSVEFSYI
ncbi:hypothetical protein QKC54_gp0632 [Megavirus baoshan]|uniref:Uncharacterized protein n=1 Tax=Megavirus baoshan TaxID=2496520 RepID=A0A3S8UWL1_9VIRU|nr:hypothetical protein QKC54_gp0632 [Megavirus baoshan]AZL89204.1 hypothetical protein Mb0440 [Megavirus baoshan]